MADWDPAQYEKFKRERDQPFWDLLALVQPRPSMRVADLGCGPGSLTRALHDKLGAYQTVGFDNSPAMLERARAFSGGGLAFAHADIATWGERRTWDLVFSNAALHWVPDHERLLGHLTYTLTPGGQLAVQVPANHDQPTHVAAEWAGKQMGLEPRKSPVLAPEMYATLLDELEFSEQHVRLQVYAHALDSREDVVEWVQGTALLAYKTQLDDAKWPEFLARYRECLFEMIPDDKPFFFPFKRILMWGRRASPASSG
jgi:trans-aconitate 2-methyltransferase